MLDEEAAHWWSHWEQTLLRLALEAQQELHSSGVVAEIRNGSFSTPRSPTATSIARCVRGCPARVASLSWSCLLNQPLSAKGSYSVMMTMKRSLPLFYHGGISTSFDWFFALGRVRAGDVGIEEVDGLLIDGTSGVSPLLTVLPMGWSGSVSFM